MLQTIFYTLSVPFSNYNIDVSNEENRENSIEGGGGGRRWWIYSNTYKHLSLSLTGCHSKGDLDRKSSSARFEGMNITESWV
jgi:hypothetical protein